jgi:hypothetical protein
MSDEEFDYNSSEDDPCSDKERSDEEKDENSASDDSEDVPYRRYLFLVFFYLICYCLLSSISCSM